LEKVFHLLSPAKTKAELLFVFIFTKRIEAVKKLYLNTLNQVSQLGKPADWCYIKEFE
jgi:hypothetical protein